MLILTLNSTRSCSPKKLLMFSRSSAHTKASHRVRLSQRTLFQSSAYCNVCLFPRTISYFFNTLFCLCLIRIRRVQINQISQVHKMAWIGSNLWRSSAPTPALKQGHLEQDTQDHVKTVFEYPQGWRHHNPPGQPVPVLSHPHSIMYTTTINNHRTTKKKSERFLGRFLDHS